MSAAVGSERIASTIGYNLEEGNFSLASSNLPQRVAVLCEANRANNVAGLDTSEYVAESLKAVGDRYGYGSPAYLIARICLPLLGGIPLVFYPQEEAGGATSKKWEITPVGTATENATHYVVIAGRKILDGQSYAFTVEVGDTAADITAKIEDIVAAVVGCPMSPSSDDYSVVLESKWRGETADDLVVSVDTDGKDAGITYAVEPIQAGAGVPSIGDALDLMDPKWNTIVINSYGENATIASALENWNGIPDTTNPTGRYVGTKMMPCIALTGTVSEDPSDFFDARKAEVTLAASPAPLSDGLPMEAAANDAAVWAVIAQNNPALDVLNKFAPDMPTPTRIGAMENYNDRDRIVKKGCATVDLVNGKYQYKDMVTTFHPEGDLQPAWRWRRDLMVDFNLRYRYRILEETFLIGKVISNDGAIVSNKEVITPSQWKQILITRFIRDAVSDGLIADEDFSAESLVVGIDTTNKDRFNTRLDYKKTGIVRISATSARSGVNTGTFSV